MPCEVCGGPIVVFGDTGERACAEDPSHGFDDDEEVWPYGGV